MFQRFFDIALFALGFAGRAAGSVGAAIFAAALDLAGWLGAMALTRIVDAFDSGHGESPPSAGGVQTWRRINLEKISPLSPR